MIRRVCWRMILMDRRGRRGRRGRRVGGSEGRRVDIGACEFRV